MTGKTEEPCPVCDKAQVEIDEEFKARMIDLTEDFYAKLAALAEAHARGEHETGQGT